MLNNEGASKKPLRMESKWVGEDTWAFAKELEENDRQKSATIIRAIEAWNDGKLRIRIVPND
jgi:hypothetical protein